jgi:hypothetical protein
MVLVQLWHGQELTHPAINIRVVPVHAISGICVASTHTRLRTVEAVVEYGVEIARSVDVHVGVC